MFLKIRREHSSLVGGLLREWCQVRKTVWITFSESIFALFRQRSRTSYDLEV